MHWFNDVLDLMVGSACASCRLPGARLCGGCRALLDEVPHRVDRDALDLPVAAANRYRPVLSHLVPAYKDDGALQLLTPLAGRLAAAVRSLDLQAPAVLVPVPSLASAKRRRGLDHGRTLARAAARMTGGRTLCLVSRRDTRIHQRGLGRDQRRSLVAGEMHVDARATPAQGVVVTDDVVTTGSSLAATVLALRSSGVTVLAAAVIGDADRDLERGVDVSTRCPGGE